MKGIARRRRGAREDLIAVYRHYAREAGLGTARHFLTQAEATFQRLADRPGIGTPYEPEQPPCAGLRYCPVSRFKKYLVFYRPAAGGIEVVRVLHGARDLPNILAEDLGVTGGADAIEDPGPDPA